MTFTFMPAVREQVSVLIALAGASGSGKTKSALRLAQGISPNGNIAFMDTEARRGLHYADTHKFIHADIRPPFKPARFLEGIKAAEASGAEVVIIDSFSNEYDGEGGIVDWADELEGKGTKSPGNWKEPKLAHKKMMNAILQCRASLIFCLRADEKIEIVRDGGRTQVRPLGWMPICEKRFMFDMTVSFTLTPGEQRGRVRYDLPHKAYDIHQDIFPEGSFFDEAAGRRLADWARGAQPAAPDAPSPELIKAGDDAASRGSDALRQWWTKGITAADRTALGHERLDRWKTAAVEMERQADDAERVA